MAALEAPGNRHHSDSTPDLVALDDDALKAEIHRLTTREREISFQRRYLHGQIEVARAELLRRAAEVGSTALSGVDIEELNRILDGPTGRDA